MKIESQETGLSDNRFFKTSLVSAIVSIVLCLSIHILTIFGIAGTIAWIGEVEHALLFLSFAFSALTAYAIIRHRREHDS